MNKRILDLLEKIENKKSEMRTAIENKNLDGAEAMKAEIENMKKEMELAKVAFEEGIENAKKAPVPAKKENKKSAVSEFINALRGKKFDNTMISGSNEDGGYTVPEDIQTQINRYLEAEDSLQPLVRVSPVSTEAGARTFQKRAAGAMASFMTVAEMANIPQGENPQFERIEYTIEKRAGFFPVSNELLADSDANISATLVEWLGNTSRVTRNRAIIQVLDSKPMQGTVTEPADLKLALNVTLDPAFRNSTVIVTNQDGFHAMDSWTYEDGRPMLQETVVFATGFQILGRQVIVLSNNDLPSTGGNAPIYVGNLNEAIELFDRMGLQVRSSDTAGQAWRTDSTEWRAVERFDVVMRDEEAFVRLQVSTAAPAAEPVAKTVKKK